MIFDKGSVLVAVAATIIAFSVAGHILSCICVVGDSACEKSCHNRFIFTNVVSVIGIGLISIALILQLYTKYKQNRHRRKQ